MTVIAFPKMLPNKFEVEVWQTDTGRFAVTVLNQGHEWFTRSTDDLGTATAAAELLREFIATTFPDECIEF